MSYLMQIIETEEQPVLSVKKTTSIKEMPNLIGKTYEEIVNYILEKNEQPIGPAFIAYYNMDMENLEIEIGFPINNIIEGKGNIVQRFIPKGKKAISYH